MVGVDVGGTFVDLLVSGNGRRVLRKTLSDPNDRAGALLAGLELVAEELGLSLREFLEHTDRIIHGSTIATNALLTRGGARTALLTTAGFRDVLNMRRGVRSDLYDPKQAPPDPLIPRQRIHPIAERVDGDGAVLEAVGEESVERAVAVVRQAGVESVAVGFLFSFANDAHERAVGVRLRETLPEVHVSLSSEVLPEVRLYERLSTTAVNAYVTPVLAAHLDSLERGLAENGFRGRLLVMQSSGGVMGLEPAARFGVRSILSGPAAGPVAGLWYAGLHGMADAITTDMGGTSFDVCLVNRGEVEVTKEMEIAGHRIALPMVAVHTIGAGGGSIVTVDGRGLLRVGPESAGATPGPVCYGRGGTRPTVTDADLLIGYLGAERFWGGRLRLDEDGAREAFRRQVAEPLGMDVVRAAYGAHQVVNANMVDAIREVSVRRGHDPRRFVLVAAGGAGPIHACAIARELDIGLIMVPREASVMCAAGQLLSDLRHDFVKSCVMSLERLDRHAVEAHYRDLRRAAEEALLAEGVPRDRIALCCAADVRYVGQFSEVEVPVAGTALTEDAVADLARDFHRIHESLNGYGMPEAAAEIVNLRVVGRGLADSEPTPARSAGGRASLTGRRNAFFDDGFREVPVHDGHRLAAGANVRGPAIVEQETTTVVLPPGFQLTCDVYGNYLVHPSTHSLEESLERCRRDASAQ
ncbi:MAG: hydantoinase/oxoprolinase family protein [Deltaproteobacteria bacterium]|nr:hydantoinase/oxoprolinase family protein [Deltaproteobacteria bacterium]